MPTSDRPRPSKEAFLEDLLVLERRHEDVLIYPLDFEKESGSPSPLDDAINDEKAYGF